MSQDIRKRRIARWSRILSLAVLFTAIALPVVSFASVLLMAPGDLAKAVYVPIDLARDAAPLAHFSVAVLAALPVLIFAGGLLATRTALSSFQRGVYFSAPVFQAFRRLAIALFISALARIVIVPLCGLVLSLGRDMGSISVMLGTSELMPVLLAAGFWLLAWIFTEAAELEAENKQFV